MSNRGNPAQPITDRQAAGRQTSRQLPAPAAKVRRGAQIALMLCAAAWALFGVTMDAEAQRIDPLPTELDGLTVTEHLDAQLPLDTPFINDAGQPITLGELFDGQRPVILSLNYSNCPMLCRVQLNGLVETLSEWPWTAGKEYVVASVSIDPRETPTRAKETKQKYLQVYGRPGAGDGWHFLVGNQESIDRLASTVGFGYRYLPERDEYVHAAVIMVCTPEGRVSRYLYGVTYDSQTLRLSLVEAGEGKIGSTLDQVLLFCFHYDAAKGRYGPTARNLMKVGGALTMLILGVALVPYWRRKGRRAAQHAAADASDDRDHGEPQQASDPAGTANSLPEFHGS